MDTVDEVVETWEDEKRRLVLVTAGKAGMGKSTLINNLLGLKGEKAAEAKLSARSVTKVVNHYEKKIHGINVRIVDTPGLEALDLSSEQEQQALATLSELTNGQPDLLLYCITLVGRFQKDDLHIVQKLTKTFGSEIWSHAILVLTYGDTALKDHGDEKKNGELLEGFTEEFEKALKKAGVSDVPVKHILSTQGIGPDKFEEALERPEVVGVPVGRCTTAPKDWVFLLWTEVFKRCTMDAIPAMLVLRGITPNLIAKLIKGLKTVHKAHSIVSIFSKLYEIVGGGRIVSLVPMVGSLVTVTEALKSIGHSKFNETFELTVLAMIIQARISLEQKKTKMEEPQMEEAKVEEPQTEKAKVEEPQREETKVEKPQMKMVEELELKKRNAEELIRKLEELQKEIKELEENK